MHFRDNIDDVQALNDGAGQLGHTRQTNNRRPPRERIGSSVLHHQITLLNIITAPRLSLLGASREELARYSPTVAPAL